MRRIRYDTTSRILEHDIMGFPHKATFTEGRASRRNLDVPALRRLSTRPFPFSVFGVFCMTPLFFGFGNTSALMYWRVCQEQQACGRHRISVLAQSYPHSTTSSHRSAASLHRRFALLHVGVPRTLSGLRWLFITVFKPRRERNLLHQGQKHDWPSLRMDIPVIQHPHCSSIFIECC